MKEMLGIFNTDRINRHGFRFDVKELESMLRQSWRGSPSFVSHDFHRLAGWTNSLGLHIQSHEVRLLGNFSYPESDEESKVFDLAARSFLNQALGKIETENKEHLKSLVGHCLSADHFFVARECISIIDDDIAARMFPELFPTDETDKRSLIDVRKLKPLAPGIFEYKGLALFAHRYFRRSLSQINNLNDAFLGKFQALIDNPNLEVRIALDPHSVGLPSTYRTPVELQYWWGPGFDDDLTKIPLGVTRHEASERLRAFHGISHIEFWWHCQNGIQSLEGEEVILNRTFGTNFNSGAEADENYGLRYVHSMVDEKTELPYHLDGAIREYDVASYIERLDACIDAAGRNSRYVKLWRVDGPLAIQNWKELICHFYRDNTLAGEYLGGGGEVPTLDVDASPPVDSSRGMIAPPNTSEKFGVHVMLSYHSLPDIPSGPDCLMVGATTIVSEERTWSVLEDSSVDFIKMLRESLSGEIQISERVEWVDYDDMDINFPHLILRGAYAVSNANFAIQRLWDICKVFARQVQHRFVTSNLTVEYEDQAVGISFAGFAADIVDALPQGVPLLPDQTSGFGDWANTIHVSLKGGRSNYAPSQEAMGLMNSSGYFAITRSFLPKSCTVMFNDEGNCYAEFPDSEQYALNMIASGKWKLRPVRIVRKLICNRCMDNYIGCTCKVLLDPSLPGASVENSEVIGFAVTERSAS